jgi:hypothetical protein
MTRAAPGFDLRGFHLDRELFRLLRDEKYLPSRSPSSAQSSVTAVLR